VSPGRVLQQLKWLALILCAFLCFIFQFFGGPDLIQTRSFKHAWDLGHVVAYAIWSVLIFRFWSPIKAWTFTRQITTILSFCIVFGGILECVQGVFDRYPAWDDMGRNILRGLLALFFLIPGRHSVGLGRLRLVQTFTLILLVIALHPVFHALLDEHRARAQFPVLADFESQFELDRWSGNAELGIDDTIVRTGRSSLKVGLSTDQYSGPSLVYFPGDWQKWEWVSFGIFNPDVEPLQLTCKITDHLHDVSGYLYEDRFNRSFAVNQGWNQIRFSMKEVENAPNDRKLDLKQISSFSLFAIRLQTPRIIYLDSLKLE